MRILKSHPLLKLANGYMIDASQPSNLNYMWNFGSLLAVCLVIQIATGVTLAMHARCDNRTMSCGPVTLVPKTANRSSGLGGGESPALNLAFLLEASVHMKPLNVFTLARSFFYDETLTSRTKMTTVLKLGDALGGYRCISSSVVCSACTTVFGRASDYLTKISKAMGFASKEEERTLHLNAGSPKGVTLWRRNIHSTCLLANGRYGSGNAERKGRNVASLLFKRTYVSGGDSGAKPTVGSKLNKLVLRSQSNPNLTIDRGLYYIVSSVDTLIYAYENIKSKPGNMTPGTSPETLDGISKETFESLSKRLRDESFKFAPSRIIQIPKASGGTRPLSIASPLDKIVQEAMRLVLEAIFEPLFVDNSHGFRPNRGCHTALKSVSQTFQPVQWVIEGDLAKFFDTISHEKLMLIIERKIKDRQFTKLIRKALKAGYFEFRKYKSNIVGTPQGSIVSPILANIFLHQLDLFVLSLKENFDKGTRAPRSKDSRFFEYHILKARKEGNPQLMRKLIAERSLSPSIDFGSDSFKKLAYVRYADDWIIGIRGTRKEAMDILDKVRKFCTSIESTLSETKTKLTGLNSESVPFLGTKITRANHASFSKIGSVRRLRRNKLGIRFEAPLDRIRKKLVQSSFMSEGKSVPKFLWLHLEHDQIILLYNAVMRGFLNYYSFVHNFPRLVSYIEYILKQSCAKLLATKFHLGTMAKVYKKFGPNLTGPKGKSIYKPSYKTTLKFLASSSPTIGALFQEKSIATLDNLKCSICESTHRVEMHHIRAMKDLNPKLSYMDRQMMRINRKRIPLCRPCHMMKHRNKETTFDK